MVLLESRGEDQRKVAAMVAALRGGGPVDPAVEKRRQQAEVVIAAVRLYPQFAEKLLEELEKAGVVIYGGNGQYSLDD